MKLLIKLYAIGPLLIALSSWSCRSTSGTSPTEMRVIERSRQERPSWLAAVMQGSQPSGREDLAAQVWAPGQAEYQLVARKDKILDITLGLDQAYELALSNMRLKVRDFLLDYWKSQGSLGQLSGEDMQLFEAKLGETLAKQLKSDLVQDIYYEKVDSEDIKASIPLSYAVYIQMKMNQSQMNSLMRDLQQFCQESSRPHLQQLAQNRQAFPQDL